LSWFSEPELEHYTIVLKDKDGKELKTKTFRMHRDDMEAVEYQMVIKAKELFRDLLFHIGLWDEYRAKLWDKYGQSDTVR
jgi:hypothetical protein